MLLPLTEMLFVAGPEARFCNLVFAHNIFKPSGAAASVKLDSLALASSADGRKSGVVSICNFIGSSSLHQNYLELHLAPFY